MVDTQQTCFMKTDLSRRVEEALSEAGDSLNTASRKMQLLDSENAPSPQAIHKWINGGEITEPKLALFCRAYGKTAAFMRYGVTQNVLSDPVEISGRQSNSSKPSSRAIEPGPLMKGRVPRLKWDQVIDRSTLASALASSPLESFLSCPVEHGQSTFCLVVRGISMENPAGEPSYRDGETIFVDPDVEPLNLDCVVVVRPGDSEATLKQIIFEGSRRYIKAVNPAWPEPIEEIGSGHRMIGVVIGTWTPARRGR